MNANALPEELAASTGVDDFLDRTRTALAPHGFEADNTLVALSTCRDEVAQPLAAAVAQYWGPAFSIGGLGGLPSGGSTAWAACLGHVPDHDRGKVLAIGLAHIGTVTDGPAGAYHRPWMAGTATTCGALGAVLGSWGDAPAGEESGDQELHALRGALAASGERPEDMVAATLLTAAAVRERIVEQLTAQQPWDRMDVAVVAGVQVHTPEGVGVGDRILVTDAGILRADGLTALEI